MDSLGSNDITTPVTTIFQVVWLLILLCYFHSSVVSFGFTSKCSKSGFRLFRFVISRFYREAQERCSDTLQLLLFQSFGVMGGTLRKSCKIFANLHIKIITNYWGNLEIVYSRKVVMWEESRPFCKNHHLLGNLDKDWIVQFDSERNESATWIVSLDKRDGWKWLKMERCFHTSNPSLMLVLHCTPFEQVNLALPFCQPTFSSWQ